MERDPISARSCPKVAMKEKRPKAVAMAGLCMREFCRKHRLTQSESGRCQYGKRSDLGAELPKGCDEREEAQGSCDGGVVHEGILPQAPPDAIGKRAVSIWKKLRQPPY